MPKFAEKPSTFDVVAEWEEEEVCLHVRWTPEADDAFVCLFEPGPGDDMRLRVDNTRAQALLLRQTTGWEGVMDTKGEALVFTPVTYSFTLPAPLKVRLLQRFVAVALTFTKEALANPT